MMKETKKRDFMEFNEVSRLQVALRVQMRPWTLNLPIDAIYSFVLVKTMLGIVFERGHASGTNWIIENSYGKKTF